MTFANKVKALIILNEGILELSEDEIAYGIVHEIAHKIAGKRKTGLMEMEAEHLLIKCSFEKESQKANHKEPRLEREGYQISYDVAERQDDLNLFEELYDE